MTHLSQHDLHELKTKLLEQKKDFENRLCDNGHFGIQASLRDTTGELSTNDNHPADVGSEMFERSKDLALNEQEEYRLTRIDEALERIENGTYGICETCGQPIDKERLYALPETKYCKAHSPQSFVSQRRPIEEVFLDPPFGRTSMDDREDQNGFDGEDAWQIVESYGSSNTPAMGESSEIDDYNDMEVEADNELDGFVEPYESFVATDIYGNNPVFYRNAFYRKHMKATKHLASEDSLGTGSNKY
ncbi:molecular chaperone DnaK [Paenibacillus sp. CAA11]|uniref:TraR/DksA C4-type zinc finger protein n=1 Tax=Paenibacillus sp. CAA11 TaxID=1532905 RepID=UPI000D37D4A1|nr:TraR/DksA C4-type zinc finger protein [Paenibacillus sp. CAA11]AWB45348.1 molecular chaperone DnaK [Paenibacillus sp. CAA11]